MTGIFSFRTRRAIWNFCSATPSELDALIIIYSQNNILLYMSRASSAHLQEDTVVHIQHMVLLLSMTVLGGLSVYSLSENSVLTQAVYLQATTNSHRA